MTSEAIWSLIASLKIPVLTLANCGLGNLFSLSLCHNLLICKVGLLLAIISKGLLEDPMSLVVAGLLSQLPVNDGSR